ncbi:MULTISPECIES: peptidyl-prolyl cis-trans isomerase [Streptococcus]|uniref:Foldase protein PrsA n=1 Tax=Streptococcus caledonicus TaxID=2614158 RepID=A0ABW0UDE6_9STRE
MKKKFATGLVTLMSITALAACAGKSSTDDKLVTMKGDYITVTDFFNQIKSTQEAQRSMVTLILDKVLEEQYGNKVTKKESDEAYNKEVEAYGSSYQQILLMNGMTEETYKQQIRVQMLLNYAIEQAAKKELTEELYQKLYNDYVPEVTAELIQLNNQDEANGVLAEVRAEGADFAKIASEKSLDKTIEHKFDSVSTEIPAEVIKAAGTLEKGAISEVISVENANTLKTSYYIVKVTAKTEKDADWKTYKDRLKETYLAEKKTDVTFQNKIIAAALEKSNVKIKDNNFSSVLSQYAATNETTTVSETTTSSEQETSEATTQK